MPMRENTAGTITHPEFLRIGADEIALVADPLTDPIAAGDMVLGWEGDARLALYFSHQHRRWVLMRFEHDGVYRMVFALDADATRSGDVAAVAIFRLIAHDSRRGFDACASIDATTAAIEAEEERRRLDWSEELAGRLRFALTKDGV